MPVLLKFAPKVSSDIAEPALMFWKNTSKSFSAAPALLVNPKQLRNDTPAESDLTLSIYRRISI